MNPDEVKQKFEELTKGLEAMREENPEQYVELVESLTEYYKALGEGMAYLTEVEPTDSAD